MAFRCFPDSSQFPPYQGGVEDALEPSPQPFQYSAIFEIKIKRRTTDTYSPKLDIDAPTNAGAQFSLCPNLPYCDRIGDQSIWRNVEDVLPALI
jgi:hypothetical protein